MRHVLAVLALSASLVACKGDRNKCEEACRNYGTLSYWRKADAEIAALPEKDREAAKRRKLGEFSSLLENGVDHCVNQCSSANNDDQTDCMIKAKTAVEADICVKD
jgi:hypothetical protein